MIPLLLLVVGYFIGISPEFKIIAAGVAIFLIGMYFMEDGFKVFAGGTLKRLLQKTTGTLMRAFFSGFIATSIVQSSSLVAVITISFLSADLIALAQAIGIIFGSNLGTTSTAWIIAAFGVKVKIAYYAMPMLIFGIILRSVSSKTYQGFGFILLGLGFIFLGIGYMKEGFDTLKDAIDLAQMAIPGFMGLVIYIVVGIAATVILQSSSASLAIIITALAAGQIEYIGAIALAIGSNIGTTITAILGSLASNINGKRLALAHLVFNLLTALIAVVFLSQIMSLVEVLSKVLGIPADNYMLKLSLFHTVFNLIGIIVILPFTNYLVRFIKKIMPQKKLVRGKAHYLHESVLQTKESALVALYKESEHLYDVILEGMIHAMLMHWHEVFSDKQLHHLTNKKITDIEIDVEHFYQVRAKNLYGEIVNYATLSAEVMAEEELKRLYELKLANRSMINILKHAKEMHKNILFYHQHKNRDIAHEYNEIRLHLSSLIREIDTIRHNEDDVNVLAQITILTQESERLDIMKSAQTDTLIREKKIDTKMATSLMNDSAFAYQISKELLEIASILWIKDRDLREFENEVESEL
ncbi:MAG: Na/Pi cotransporter family protein [Campylobacterota bacterium]|nr:Na/Pi cotransporter family protein [Campylobacterota bacterium]